MPFRNLEAVFFCDEMPEVEIRDGLFHVCFSISRAARIEIVIPPRVWFAGMRNALQVQNGFNTCEVLPLRSPDSEELATG